MTMLLLRKEHFVGLRNLFRLFAMPDQRGRNNALFRVLSLKNFGITVAHFKLGDGLCQFFLAAPTGGWSNGFSRPSGLLPFELY